MQNFEQLGRELERRGKTEQIKQLAESEDGVKLAKLIDANAVEQAAKSGDGEAFRLCWHCHLWSREEFRGSSTALVQQ